MAETAQLDIAVYRRDPAEPGDTAHAWDMHRLRRRALEDAFAAGSGIEVADWGEQAKDEKCTHELAELIVVVDLAVQHVIVPGAQRLADKLVELGVDAVLAGAAKAVWSKLRGKQKAKDILDFQITFPDGTWVQTNAPEMGSKVTITSAATTVEISAQQQTT